MYRELIDSRYTTLRRMLLKEKGSDYQREFVTACRESKSFVDYINQEVGATDGEPIKALPSALSEHEFKEPPRDTEETINTSWNDILPAVACRNTFWGMVTLSQIQAQVIESTFLAGNGVSGASGKARIDYVLHRGASKDMDGCVRTILRRFSGLPEARGNRSIYVNCPLARGWWRQRLCREVVAATQARDEDVMKVLRLSQEYWENIVSMMVSRNSVFGDRSVRDVIVSVIAASISENSSTPLNSANTLRLMSRIIGARAAWQEFGILSIEELSSIVEGEITNAA